MDYYTEELNRQANEWSAGIKWTEGLIKAGYTEDEICDAYNELPSQGFEFTEAFEQTLIHWRKQNDL